MRPLRRIATRAALVCALLGALCGTAIADPLTRVERAYAAGGISPCRFSAAELTAALGEIPGDVAQYDADLIDAIHRALAAKPATSCNGTAEAGAGSGLSGSGSGPAPSPPVRPVGAATGSGVPAPLLILAALVALWALCGVAWGVTRFLGLDPRWARAVDHALRETGDRLAHRWAGIGGRSRTGR